jgi:outer membrane protein assembly factor BamB
VQWSESKNIKWKVPIPGEGNGTPIVWENKVFVVSAIATGKKAEGAAAGAAAKSESPRESTSSSGGILDRFDVDKDGKISRAEIPEGTLRDVFDRMVDRYKLDAAKTYTREELEKATGMASSAPQGSQNPGRPGGNRRPGAGGPGGAGGGGGMRSVNPTEPLQFVLLCLDRATGKTLWQQVAREELPHEGHHPDGSFAASSPVTDGKHVFAFFGSRGLYCYDMDGKAVWSQDFGDMRTANRFGEGSSPALAGNAVIIKWDHEGESFIVSVHKETGKVLWKTPRDERTSWSTPLVVEHGGKAQVITSATRKVRSYDAETGEVIWECSGLGPNAIPTPVAGAGMVFAMSGFRSFALLAIRLDATGDVSETDAVAWRLNRGTPYVPSPLLYGDRLYFFSGNQSVLTCVDAKSGEALMEARRLDGLGGVYASPVGAGGRVYLVGRDGVTLVIAQTNELEVLGKNQLDERFDASPAIAGNQLFLRGRQHLYCIAE